MTKRSVRFIFMLMMLVDSIAVFGQGSIRGVISDGASSKPLAGANVFIVGTSLYLPRPISGFSVPANFVRDTSSAADQTVLLPNLNRAYSPFEFAKNWVHCVPASADRSEWRRPSFF